MIAQVGILLFGVAALFLVNDPNPRFRRWGPVLGLIGQPFWFYSAFIAEQWGIFSLCFAYTFAWARGAYHAWWKR